MVNNCWILPPPLFIYIAIQIGYIWLHWSILRGTIFQPEPAIIKDDRGMTQFCESASTMPAGFQDQLSKLTILRSDHGPSFGHFIQEFTARIRLCFQATTNYIPCGNQTQQWTAHSNVTSLVIAFHTPARVRDTLDARVNQQLRFNKDIASARGCYNVVRSICIILMSA